MFFSHSSIVHQEVIELSATAEQVREYIMTPERILDYYPTAIDGGVIEAGASIYCRGKTGVSLLEVIPEHSSDQLLVIKVTTATKIKPPFTKERIKKATFFTMIEHWKIESCGDGTTLTKTWRNIKKSKFKLLPMGLIVRSSAKKETAQLKAAWDKEALK